MIQLIQDAPLSKPWLLRNQLAVPFPERWPQGGAPAHSPLCLMMPVIGCWVVNAGLSLAAANVAAPQIAVQHRRLHSDALKERLQAVGLVANLRPNAKQGSQSHACSLTVLAALLLMMPLMIMVLWFNAQGLKAGHDGRKEESAETQTFFQISSS